MEVKVIVHNVIIRDETTGKEFPVKTLRTAQDIAEELQENEKHIIVSTLEEAVIEVLNK